MANYSALGALRQRLGLISRPTPVCRHPFTDTHWADAARQREYVDSLIYYPNRFAVTVVPADGAPRHFILRGSLESVTRRAQAFFADKTHVLVIEPHPYAGGESFDRRLSLSKGKSL